MTTATLRRRRSRQRATWHRIVVREFTVDGRGLNRMRRMVEAVATERAWLARVQVGARMAVLRSRQDRTNKEINAC